MTSTTQRDVLRIWHDVIFALFIREIKSRFNDRLGLAWTVIQPIIFIVILSLMRGRLDSGWTHTMPTFVFVFYGISVVLFFNATINSVYNSVKKNKALFAFRQVTPIAAIISSSFFELFVQLFIYTTLYLMVYLLKIDIVFNNALLIIYCILCVWIIALSIGTIFAMVRCFIPEFDKIKSILMRPLIFISGVFFSLKDVPRDIWHLLDWNPILHCIEIMRGAAYLTFQPVGVSLSHLSFVMLASLTLGLCIYTAIWKRAISN
ncbi:ABC transporter permease [Vibrio sinaloensis]|uniref:Transport permease protein n=1 Tax=Photobacterium sp. (strain ATCC 43367) TaxID=379097 RepID=A0A0A5HUP3_PHOS4|nr:ABC transporter permease [Vibrio sinaloensis]KGY07246.1 ABC transporter [Vibrio sinaloensis]